MKMHPSFDAAIARILLNDPKAVVILLRSSSQAIWQDAFQRRLIEAITIRSSPDSDSHSDSDSFTYSRLALDRIIFLDQMNHEHYSKVICGGDVTLDPFPFGGGVTLTDSLACLIPVPFVTSAALQTVHALGRGFAKSMGLPIADSFDSYVELAISTANHSHSSVYGDIHIENLKVNRNTVFDVPTAAAEWDQFLRHVTNANVFY